MNISKNKINVIAVDDHPFFLKGFVSVLKEFDYISTTFFNNCDDAFKEIVSHKELMPYDILFADLSFDNTKAHTIIDSGIALIQKIKSLKIPIKICVFSGYSETNRIYHTINNVDPHAYILKSNCNVREIGLVLESIARGEKYYSPEIFQKLMKRTAFEIKMDEEAIQILQELPKHNKIKNMVGVIKKSDGTVLSMRSIEFKLNSLRLELNANNNIHLLLIAKELGII